MGMMMARECMSSGFFDGIDYIVPVPLHRKKELERGYNQSEWIAQGIADEAGVPLCTDALVCHTHRESQTRKGIYERYLATREVFELLPDTPLVGANVLLVDDVVTTGATAARCASLIKRAGAKRIFMLSIAKVY